MAILSWIVRDKKRILETGTYWGHTTINLAKFSPPDAKIYTVDMDQSKDRTDMKVYPELLKKITFVTANTRTFDFKSLNETFDMVFIDGDHTFDGVRAETKGAWSVLSNDGMIFWHDSHSPIVVSGICSCGLRYVGAGNGMVFCSKSNGMTCATQEEVERQWQEYKKIMARTVTA